MVVGRAWRAIAGAAELLVATVSASGQRAKEQGGTEEGEWARDKAALLLLFTGASWELLQTQDLYLGLHHSDRASTLHDLSSGIQTLLALLSTSEPSQSQSSAPAAFTQQHLARAFPQWGGTFASASHMENAARREFGRVRALYD